MLEINLLPVREVRKRAEARQSVMQLVLVMLLTCTGIGAFHARLRSEMNRVQGRIHQMEKDIAQFKPQLDQVEAFKKKKGELEKKIDVIDGLDRARRGPVRLMAELADRIPDRVWLTSLDTNGGMLKLQGESLDNELVALFLRDLGQSEYFDEVDLESTKVGADKGGLKTVRFDMKAALVSPEAAKAPVEAEGDKKAGKAGKGAKAPKGPTAAAASSRDQS
jgi:type IV pilus assembly protein PilN